MWGGHQAEGKGEAPFCTGSNPWMRSKPHPCLVWMRQAVSCPAHFLFLTSSGAFVGKGGHVVGAMQQ
jgi:hypothetical protein